MFDADVDQGVAALVDDGVVEFLQNIKAFDYLAEDGSFPVQVVCVVAEGDDELGAGEAGIGVGRVRDGGHADGATLEVFEFGVEEGWEGLFGGVAGEEAPDGLSAIGIGGQGTKRVAGLEGEGLLDGVDGREVVVFDLAEFEEAVGGTVSM